MKRLILALAAGATIVFLGVAILRIPGESSRVNSLKWATSGLMAPGVMVGLIVSGGRVDDVNMWVSDSANVIVYAGVFYGVLSAWSKIKSKN